MGQRRLVSLIVFWLGLGLAQDPGPPTWPDGSVLGISSMGLGTLLLSWPVADNNVYELIGYRVYISDSDSPQVTLIYDGNGIVTVRQYLVTNLVPGGLYSFYIEALNTDPTGTVVLTSSFLFRAYTLATPIGLDPTTLTSTTYSITAGVTVTLPIFGRQPSTGNLQDVGPVCLVTEKASCVPGRTFVAFIEPPCELEAFDSTCEILSEATGFDSATLPYVKDYYGPLSVAYDENNVGQYKVEVTGERAGELRLGLHAITPNQLLGLYWSNPSFLGEPSDTRLDPMIDFSWSSGAIVGWVNEFVSVRWLGYLKPESTGEYLLSCWANTYSDVWIDNVHVIASNQSPCVSGCSAVSRLTLKRAHYYKLRVDYVTTTGDSFVSLKWQEPNVYPTRTAIPSEVFQRGAYVAQAPLTVQVAPGRVVALKSFLYGSDEALYSPMAGKRYTLFVQVKDEYGNACNRYDSTDSVTISVSGSGTAFTLAATPHNSTVTDCVYSSHVTYKSTGSIQVSAFVNGVAVMNSPVQATVSPGVLDPLLSTFEPLLVNPVVGKQFDVTVVPRDSYGNRITDLKTVGNARFKLQKDWSVAELSSDGCSSRSNATWMIYCWTNDFSFVDDSLINAQVFSPISESITNFTINSDGNIVVKDVVSFYQGPHILSVFIEDTLVGGSALPLVVSVGSELDIDPSLCIVRFDHPTSVVIYESDIVAIVLIRDEAGNVLYDRDDVDVKLVFETKNPSKTRQVPCTYVPDKYYRCDSYADTEGLNRVKVTVEGSLATRISGGPPSSESCADLLFCGSSACPCEQYREPAEISLDVISP